MSIERKIALALLLVLSVATASTALLAYAVYERTLSTLVESRFQFIARELQRKVEVGLDLGLPLGGLDFNAVLLQQRLADAALESLSILDAHGEVLFTTDATLSGRKLDAPWLAAMRMSATSREDVVIGESEIDVGLFNSFGRLVGGLSVRYASKFYAEKRQATARKLAAATGFVLLLCGVAGTIGSAWLCRPLQRALQLLDASGRAPATAQSGAGAEDALSVGAGDTAFVAVDDVVSDAAGALALAEATLSCAEQRAGAAE